MKIKVTFLVMIFSAVSPLFSQDALSAYIHTGLENNLSMQQQSFSLLTSLCSLRRARGMFLPSISIEARYTRAGGGRVIEFPVGDLMNPVYQTLNQLLSSQGMTPLFPDYLPNETIPFLREKEHETKVRFVQPLFQPALMFNYSIQKRLHLIQKASKTVFARQLVSDIKTAYFNYLKTIQIEDLLDTTALLLKENLRVNQSLYRNGKATQASVSRARSDIFELEQNRAEAQKNMSVARSYFNFLLNRPLDTPIDTTGIPAVHKHFSVNPGLCSAALENREELFQMKQAIDISQKQIGLSRTAFLPSVTAVADWGYQGESYSFTPRDDYWMASLVVSWNLFNGFQDRNKTRQASLIKHEQELQFEELKNKIVLQVKQAQQNLLVACRSLAAAKSRRSSARKTFSIVNRKFREGIAPQLEYLDARTTMTRAEINAIVSEYNVHIKVAELERVTASYLFSAQNQ